ncbi:MAG: helix-turn-helix domain-containing protein, partial [Lachnospiraceae bacterium]|nr:helix-turn-helix domain-containing protein [Lachnospiraceae bacterium]
LSISEMAGIMGISRQTLIYYDKINLLKPEYVDAENGYRYYSTTQLPLLRDICFLKSIGISLKDIQEKQLHPKLSDTIALLRQQSDRIDEEINRLSLQKWELEKRIYIYEHNQSDHDYAPLVQSFPKRILLFHPWNENNLSAEGIHQILQIVWNQAKKSRSPAAAQVGNAAQQGSGTVRQRHTQRPGLLPD